MRGVLPTATALILIGSALALRPQTADRADRLIDRWIEAGGGLEAWHQIDDAKYTVVTVWFDSTETETRRRPRFVWLKKHPERARIERDEPEGHYVQAHNAEVAWATLDGERLPEDHKATEETFYVGRDVMYWFGLPYKLRDPGVHLDYIPKDSIGMEGVKVSFGEGVGDHPGDRYFYYFEEDSPFPVQVHYIEQGSTSVDRTIWTDYQEAPPITYVGTRTYIDEQGRTTKQLIIKDVEINPGLPDSIFEPPARDG